MNRFTLFALIFIWSLLYSWCWNCYRKPECSGIEVVAEHTITADTIKAVVPPPAPVDTTEEVLTPEEQLLFTPIDIYFNVASTNIVRTAEIDTFLTTAKKYLEKNPGEKLMATGYSDSDGSEELNLKLSGRRADSVKGILVRGGFKDGQIDVTAKGEAEPIAENTTPENKAKNRRVTLRLIK